MNYVCKPTMTVTYTADLRVGGRTPIAVVVDIGVHWREHVVANRARLVVVFISDINGSSQTLSIHRRICITHTHTHALQPLPHLPWSSSRPTNMSGKPLETVAGISFTAQML